MNQLTFPGRANSQLGAIQVNVVDYKLFTDTTGISDQELQAIRDYSRKLIDALRTYTTFMTPGDDKVSTNIKLEPQEDKRKLRLNLHLGVGDEPFIKPVTLPLPEKFHGRLQEDSLHEALAAISTTQPGGNVPNMIRNITHVMKGKILPPDVRVLLHSTEEPVFQAWFDALAPEVRERITMHSMDIPPRKGVHLPYSSDLPGGIGTLGMITPMHSAIQVMRGQMANLARCNHVLVSESLGQLVSPEYRGYKEFHNPSSAFREQCALENYNLMLNGGRIPIVSVNDEEMVKYLASIESRRALHASLSHTGGDEGERKPKKPSFGYPFDEHRKFNDATAALATESFSRYFACIPPQIETETYFPLSVSCGPYGGYHISCTPDGKRYVIFTSTPQGEGVQKMLDIIGPNEEITIETKRTMGAGDAVSSVLSLAHLLDIEQMMGQLKSPQHPINAKFIEIAASIFVSLLSRFAGEILYHSNRCDWMSVPPEKFRDIITATARKGLGLAAEMWNRIDPKPTIAREPEWNIDVAVWQLDHIKTI